MSQFEWDVGKAKNNLRKHGVSFEEAVSVFSDALAIELVDESHSTVDETRFLTLGTSIYGRLLVVAICERGGKIRLISARTTTAKERASYEAKGH